MSSNLGAFLAVIRAGEGTADEDGYRRMFGGELFDSFSDHPRRAITKRLGGRMLTSTAAGAYQFLSRTWDECAKALELPDFSPANKDAAAEYLIRRRGAFTASIPSGDLAVAVSSGTQAYGTRSVSVTGGTGSLTYSWRVTEGEDRSWVDGSSTGTSVDIKGTGTAVVKTFVVTCFVQDSTGRMTSAQFTVTATHA